MFNIFQSNQINSFGVSRIIVDISKKTFLEIELQSSLQTVRASIYLHDTMSHVVA